MWEDQPAAPRLTRTVFIAVVLCVLLALIAVGTVKKGFFRTADPVATPTPDLTKQLTPDEVATVLQQIGLQVPLPVGETPVVEVVRNLEALPKAELLTHAVVGDILVMYQKSAKMVLYHRQNGTVVGVAVITPSVASGFASPPVPSPAATAASAPVVVVTPAATPAPQPAHVYWLNASGIVARTAVVEDALPAELKSQIVSDGRSNAKVRVTGTLVIDRTGNRSELAQKLATALGGTVGSLPDGEPSRDGAEIMIIVAK